MSGFFGPGLFPGGFFGAAGTTVETPSIFADIPDLALLVESDYGITLETTDTTTIQRWKNRASTGSGYDFIQPSKQQQPTLVSSQINGYPAVVFDGVDDIMTLIDSGLNLLRNVSGATVYIVLASTQPAGNREVISISTGTNMANPRFWHRRGTLRNDEMQSRAGDSDSSVTMNSSNSIWTANTWYAYSFTRDYVGQTSATYQNGVSKASASSVGVSSNTSDTASLLINIGGRLLNLINLSVAMIAICTSSHGTSDRQATEDLIQTKYGITMTH